MTSAEYSLYLSDPTGDRFRKNITGMVLYADIYRAENGPGTIEVGIDPAINPQFIKRDARIFVYRKLPGRLATLLWDTAYFLRYESFRMEQSRTIRVLRGPDCTSLLARPIIAYKGGTSQARKVSVAIDDMMKALVRENRGASATDTTRNLSDYLTVAPDATLAPTTTRGMSHRNLLKILRELAQESAERETYLSFDVTAVNETDFLFQTYIGQRGLDRRAGQGNQFKLSPRRGNAENIVLERDYRDEITRAYAGGEGKGSKRNVQTWTGPIRSTATPFNLIEVFVDARHLKQSDTAALLNVAKATVRRGRPRTNFSCDIRETDGSMLGVHFDFGDYVTAEMPYYTFDARLSVMRLRLSRASTNEGFAEEISCGARLETDPNEQ